MKVNVGEEDDADEELSDQEIEAILEALDSFDEVKESEVDLELLENSVDEEHRDLVRRISIQRIPCTSHKVMTIYKFIVYRI